MTRFGTNGVDEKVEQVVVTACTVHTIRVPEFLIPHRPCSPISFVFKRKGASVAVMILIIIPVSIFHNLYSSPNIIRMVESRKMRWTGNVARMVGKSEGKRPLGRPDVGGRIVLTRILEK
jgi:hypothetical protein